MNTRKVKLSIGVGIALILLAASGHAQNRDDFYRSVRSLGMGGAGIAVVNDETSLLVNPAGLGKLRDVFGTVFDPELTFSESIADILVSDGIENFLDLRGHAENVVVVPDTFFHSRAQMFPSLVAKNFGVGLYLGQRIDGIWSSQTEEYIFDFQRDMAFVMGFNLNFWGGRIKLGATGRLVSRLEADGELDVETGDFNLNNIGREGLGLGTDIGLKMTAPWRYLPTLAVVARDVGGTSFNIGSGHQAQTTDRPHPVSQDIDVGVAFFPIHGGEWRSSWSLEYKGLLSSSDDRAITDHLHLGGELNYADFIFLRGGMHQMYYTFGIEYASESYQLQMASYGEEIGTTNNPVEDRRYVFKFSFRF